MKVSMNDTPIFVGTGGVEWKPEQPALLLQHGAGMDRTVWVLLARYFSRHGFNVVAADLPEHGASQGQALTTIEAQASHVWQLLDVLKEKHGLPDTPMHLAGHSMGSLIACEMANQRLANVAGLLLFGAGYPMPVGQPLLDAAQQNRQAAVDMITLYSHSFQSQLGHNPVAGISVQNFAMALLERAKPDVLYTDLKACNDYKGLETLSTEFKSLPCTLISGRKDRMTPLKAASHLSSILEAELTVVESCGHMLMSEQPEATLQAAKQSLNVQ